MADGAGPERPGPGSERPGSGPESASAGAASGSSGGRSGPPTGVMVAGLALVGVGLVVGAVVVGVRMAGDYSSDATAWGPITSLTATPVDLPDRDRSGTSTSKRATSTASTTARRTGGVCDARRINADLGYPASGSRVISCADGWAVMASAQSGDPYWVSYRDGRWQTVDDISMYLMTCPDEAISRGAPEWIAQRHLGNCPALSPRTTLTEARPPAPRPTAPGPARPTVVPTSPVVPTSSTAPATTSAAETPTTTIATTRMTTTTPASSTPAAAEVAE